MGSRGGQLFHSHKLLKWSTFILTLTEAKERGDSNYQQLYNEYLQPQEMNFQLKAIINEDNLITLYYNVSPKGTEWQEVKMSDFILGAQ